MTVLGQPMKRSKLVIVLSCFLALLALASWGAIDLMHVTRIGQGQWRPQPAMVDELLRSMDLDPQALAVCGVQAQEVEAMISDIERYLTVSAADFQDVRLDYDQVTQFLRESEEPVRAGKADGSLIASRKNARQALPTVEADYQRHLRALLGYAQSRFTDDQRRRWQALRDCRAIGYDNLPIELQILPLTEPRWVQLRDALAHERINTERGRAVEQDVQELLQQVRTSPEVVLAKQNHDQLLEPVTRAWQRDRRSN